EVGDVEGPADGAVQSPGADAGRDLITDREHAHAEQTQRRQEGEPPEPGGAALDRRADVAGHVGRSPPSLDEWGFPEHVLVRERLRGPAGTRSPLGGLLENGGLEQYVVSHRTIRQRRSAGRRTRAPSDGSRAVPSARSDTERRVP